MAAVRRKLGTQELKAFVVLSCLSTALAHCNFDLPERHLNILCHRKPEVCAKKSDCKLNLKPTCFGYEPDCNHTTRFEPRWPHSCSLAEERMFWREGDFGYLSIKKELLDLQQICKSANPEDSSLNCTERLQYCSGCNIIMDLRNPRSGSVHPRDPFQEGEVGGICDVNKETLFQQQTSRNLDQRLRSWYEELKHFSDLTDSQSNATQCDLVIDKPVILLKLDQGNNMYHRFCDFFNLYLSMMLNDSIEFSKDVQLVIWNWTWRDYVDQFPEVWKTFSAHPLTNIRNWFGKRVCFRSVIFPFLPRMIMGLFYNARLADNCVGSGMMKSFSQFIMHRMKVEQHYPKPNITRVTLLTRRDYDPNAGHRLTMYRKIVNEDQLIKVLKNMEGIETRVVEYNPQDMKFHEQLTRTGNTDIFISMHGAGLTHLLFLPDWAVVFELYDCGAVCFRDLARLRGMRHITWQNLEKMTRHDGDDHYPDNPRYWNYSFDPVEFRRLVLEAMSMVNANGWREETKSSSHGEL